MEQTKRNSRLLEYPSRWMAALRGCNVPAVERSDALSRWLVISRSCVLTMTLTSAVIGVLVALQDGAIHWGYALLSAAGLLLAHASNNMLNDWTDSRRGVDTANYPRVQYSVHPLLGGLTTSRGLIQAVLILLALDAAIMVTLAFARGWPVLVFALSGLVLSLTYTGFLKRFALGELASLIVWGPLMIAGTAYVASGRWDPVYLLHALPYGLIVATVLVGKHIDKLEADRAASLRSLPVLLGERGSRTLTRILFVLFYVLIAALVVTRIVGPGVLLSLLALFRLVKTWKHFGAPRPSLPPEGWPVWPLWYVGWAMYFNRHAGGFYILGLIVNLALSQI
ncbi:MAG: prenyltransferase [Spirochaetaceae bacterium]|nr:MAG: prenyltransferase [Spirochaetaceae bacterium]